MAKFSGKPDVFDQLDLFGGEEDPIDPRGPKSADKDKGHPDGKQKDHGKIRGTEATTPAATSVRTTPRTTIPTPTPMWRPPAGR